ncbi:hypothetical protein SapgrDRAFT_1235 [Saprospira grandis DSM 2844]|uniref:Uncharacterized protein n=1 Tax=Saprospira grandis DSM 2844 TaxID=694433 RepID=J1I3P8_9BACT|nr:hypothetical protein SapgrDRAFT_1235 [Saprospira grandis DSM 2844]
MRIIIVFRLMIAQFTNNNLPASSLQIFYFEFKSGILGLGALLLLVVEDALKGLLWPLAVVLGPQLRLRLAALRLLPLVVELRTKVLVVRARRSARPCVAFGSLVWPDGHPAASVGRLAFGHSCRLKPAARLGPNQLALYRPLACSLKAAGPEKPKPLPSITKAGAFKLLQRER